jgi:hypothetical protein
VVAIFGNSRTTSISRGYLKGAVVHWWLRQSVQQNATDQSMIGRLSFEFSTFHEHELHPLN